MSFRTARARGWEKATGRVPALRTNCKRILVAGLIVLALPWLGWADGGALLLREHVGQRIFSVFIDPAEMTVGPVEVMVLIEGDNGRPVVGEPVEVALNDNLVSVVSKSAIWGGGGNRVLAVAQLMLPRAGEWTLKVKCGGGEVSRRVRVAEPRGRFLSHWREWLFVPVILTLFLWHQWLAWGAKPALRARNT